MIIIVGYVGLCFAMMQYVGGGKVVSVSAVPTVMNGFTSDVVSVYNSGAAVVYVQVNSTGTAVSNAAAAGTAVPIPANVSYTFDARDKRDAKGLITSVAVVTASGTATAYVSWY